MSNYAGGDTFLLIGGALDGQRLTLGDTGPTVQLMDYGQIRVYHRWQVRIMGHPIIVYLAEGLSRFDGMKLLIQKYPTTRRKEFWP